jgi:two-component system OmpR family response regulator
MSASVAILIARADFSVGDSDSGAPQEREECFFRLLSENQADAIVLDLSENTADASSTIAKIKQRTTVPIVVVTGASEETARRYRYLGAAECVPAPVNLWQLTTVIKQLKSLWLAAQQENAVCSGSASIPFGRLLFNPDWNGIANKDGQFKTLTTCESRILAFLLSRPRRVISREDLLNAVYNHYRPVSDRAIDVLINRLRTKLRALGGAEAAAYIRTEFRAGYVFVAQVGTAIQRSAAEPPLAWFPRSEAAPLPGALT